MLQIPMNCCEIGGSVPSQLARPAMTAPLDAPTRVRESEELDSSKLEPFLRTHFSNERDGFVVRQFPSGHSNLTYSVLLGDREMVLRRPPFGTKVKTAHDMSREFRVLSKLHDAYPPAPRALCYCDDEGILGAPFYLMERVRGVIIRRDTPSGLEFSAPTARRLSENFTDNLARLHSLDYTAIGLAGIGKPEGYLFRQVSGWIERYAAAKTHDLPEAQQIADWMQQHIPSPGDAALIHNDYKYDNVVLHPTDPTEILAVLDWEMSTIGDPLTDLGTTLAYWVDPDDSAELQEIRWGPTTSPGSLTRAELAERYARKTGRDITHIRFYLAFARFKVAVIVQQIYYRYHHGLTKDARFAAMPAVVKALLRASVQTAQSDSI
jgi:aminoglycoside phosphotransferase (APT) family kinase protein